MKSILIVLMFVFFTSVNGCSLLIVTDATEEYRIDVVGKLQNSSIFSSVNVFVMGAPNNYPTSATLDLFDSVLYYTDGGSTFTTLGDTLADYVDSGKGLVLAVHTTSNQRLNGKKIKVFLREIFFLLTNYIIFLLAFKGKFSSNSSLYEVCT